MEILHAAEFDSPVGPLRVVSSEGGLAYVALPHSSGRGLEGWMRRHAPDGELRQAFAPNQAAVTQILEFLEGKRRRFELALDLRATDFQHAVYAAMLEIPYGETRTYAQLAEAIGRPRSVRAVGAASGANPISLVVPCHRVIGSSGSLTGYGGGVELKARLLAMEGTGPADGKLL